MVHDIKCPLVAPSLAFGNERVCQCELIKVVRADERQAEANRRTKRFGVWHDYDPGFP